MATDEAAVPAMRVLREYLARLAPVPEAELSGFLVHTALGRYRRGGFFTRAGDTHDRVGVVAQGLFRVYYTGADGAYHVRNFCKEGMPVGSYATVLTGSPAHVDIEALEDSVVVEFSYAALARRFERSAAWERMGRRLAEDHYVAREQRTYTLLALDALGRLERFHEDFPGLGARVTGADIASYIGVRPETLSRLLRKRRRG